jgi:hypothetical protein
VVSNFLIAIGKTTHTRHHAENVVVGRIHVDRGGRGSADRVVGHREEERGVINTGQVARAAGLVLLRLEGEGVHVDADGGDVGVVLVGLDLVEIAALTNLEAVVAVELDERGDAGVLARHTLNASHGVTRLEDRAVPPVREVERLLALPGVDDRGVARHEGIALDNPDELLTRVVEVQLELVGGRGDGLTASELENLDEVLVGHLGELATLIRVEVDVVDIEGGGDEAGVANTGLDGRRGGGLGGVGPHQVLEGVELEVDAHLVVLEGDQGQRKTRVAAEPELEGDVQGVLRRAVEHLVGRVGLTAGAVIVAGVTTLDEEVGELGHVANHLGVAGLEARLLGELIPDLEPLAIVLVDALAANLELNVVDEVVAGPVEPAELSTRAVRGEELHLGESGLEVHTVDQVTVALDRARHLLAEVGGAVEGILDRLHGEVGVSAVHNLEESDLGVASQVNILSTISDELH